MSTSKPELSAERAIQQCLDVLRPIVKGMWPHEQALEELARATAPGKDTGLLVGTDAVGSFIGMNALGGVRPVERLDDAEFVDGSDATDEMLAEIAAKGVTLHRVILCPLAAPAPAEEHE